jgi:hypothetical protein
MMMWLLVLAYLGIGLFLGRPLSELIAILARDTT